MEVLFLHQYQAEIAKLSQILPFEFATSYPKNKQYDRVIRWGNFSKIPDTLNQINSRRALLRCQNISKALPFLRSNGIRCPKIIYNKKPEKHAKKSLKIPSGYITLNKPIVRRYRVYVFDCQVLALAKKVENSAEKPEEIPIKNPYFNVENAKSSLDEKEWDKVCLAAAKALYYLGLTFGAVDVGIEQSGRSLVYHIEPAPPLSDYLVRAYAFALRKYLGEQSEPLRVTLGADPEFMLRNRLTKTMVLASNFFPQKGLVGCDQRSIARKKKKFPLAELRPKPELEPLMLFENLRSAMHVALKMVPYSNIEWVAGSEPFEGYQIGGHIHFGGCTPTAALLRALDNYLAIPVMLLENSNTSEKRRSKYGYIGDFRWQDYGGFEYRTLGCWLVSPRITKAVLCLAYLVVTNHQKLHKDFFSNLKVSRAFYHGKKEAFYEYFKILWEDISRLPEYTNYQKELSVFTEMIQNRKRWRENVDIRKTWRLPIPKQMYYAK